MGDDLEPEAIAIVRRYSDKLLEDMPEEILTQALDDWNQEKVREENEATVWQTWLRFSAIESEPDVVDLEKACRDVADAWRDFQRRQPKLKLFEGFDRPPNIQSLKDEVDIARDKWDQRKETGFGKAKDHTMSFLQTLDGHKALFSIFPSGEKYTSLFTGVVSSIVKASVSYEQAAEGFSRALADIGADMSFVRKSSTISNTPEMRRLVVELYVHVFKFLCDMMTWFSSKGQRFKSSFNSSFYNRKIQDQVNKIRLIVQGVERNANFETQKRVFETRSHVQALSEGIEERFQHVVALELKKFEKSLRLDLGTTIAHLLAASAQDRFRSDSQKAENVKRITQGEPDEEIHGRQYQSHDSVSKSVRHLLVSQDTGGAMLTEQETKRLQRSVLSKFFSRASAFAEDAKGNLRPPNTLQIANFPDEIMTRVNDWIQESEALGAHLLWVEGSGYQEIDVVLTDLAVQIYGTALHSDIQYLTSISFFCQRDYSFRKQPMSIKKAGLIAMIYCLIGQLVKLVPAEFDAPPNLSQANFERLNGDERSVQPALAILDDLLEMFAPASLVVVIDGIESLECKETIFDLSDFLKIIRKQRGRHIVKVLFTTHGACMLLQRKTSVHEHIKAERMVQSRRRSPMPGAMYVNDVGFR